MYWLANGKTGIIQENGQANGQALTVVEYEARIALYREQIGVGYIGIGRTLNEAKAAGVVPHGQWEDWVQRVTGLTVRQAQRCMQAATEIRDGSAMARLEMSKAMMLLSSGLDEEQREEIAEKAADEGATVKALREEIAKAKQEADKVRKESDEAIAEAYRKSREARAAGEEELRKLKLQAVNDAGAAAELKEALKKANEARDRVVEQLKELRVDQMENIRKARDKAYDSGLEMGRRAAADDARKAVDMELGTVRKSEQAALDKAARLQADLARIDGERKQLAEMIGSERVKAEEQVRKMKQNQADLLAAAEEAEQRAAAAEEELEALRAGGADQGGKEIAWKVLKVAVTRMMADVDMLPLDPAGLMVDRARIESSLGLVEAWLRRMREAMSGVISGEGAIV